MIEFNVHFEFHSIHFACVDGLKLARTSGELKVGDQSGPFGIALSPGGNGEWILRDTRVRHEMKAALSKEVMPLLVNRAAKLLKTTNMWPEQQTDGAARIFTNQMLPPSEVADKVVISFRPDMLCLPVAKWDSMWDWIEARVANDDFFSVQGFGEAELLRAIHQLKDLYPSEWVAARYREASGQSAPTLGTEYSPQAAGWYPACHLARTALGAICIDPAWNYLVELGLSIDELSGFDRLDDLKKQVVRSPGTQHHLCLAAELRHRNFLMSLEPLTGSGSATNDLRVQIAEDEYDIEVKEFSSASPAKRLINELYEKNMTLPLSPSRPVVFHVVLVERGMFDPKLEQKFYEDVRGLMANIPEKISAVVAGRRFVDSTGGRIKRDTQIILLNPRAIRPCRKEYLEQIFEKNYKDLTYPLFGIGSFFHFARDM